MSTWRRGTVFEEREGSILIEVVVAIVLLAILIGPLAGRMISAVGRAKILEKQVDAVVGPVVGSNAARAWSWGPKVASAWWEPGPTLSVRPERWDAEAPIVGFWVNGWVLAEESPDADGLLVLGAANWSAEAGSELVVRVRTSDGVWGPPWRSIVPGGSGIVALPAPTWRADGAQGEAIVHAPGAGNPDLEPSWGQPSAESRTLGLPILFPAPFSGPGGLSLDSKNQSWLMEPTRDLDLYF